MRSEPHTFADDRKAERPEHVRHLPPVYVQAAVYASPYADWINVLRSKNSSANGPLKWKDENVRSFVTSKLSSDAEVVRDRLAQSAYLSIFDASAWVRHIDLRLAGEFGDAPPLLSVQWARKNKFTRQYQHDVLKRSGTSILTFSGAGRLHGLMNTRMGLDVDFDEPTETFERFDPRKLAESLGGLDSIARVALHCDSLLSHERNRDHPVWKETSRGKAYTPMRMIYGGVDPYFERLRLEAAAKHRLLLDEGHKDASDCAAEIHGAVVRRYKDLNFENDDSEQVGYVITGTDGANILMQVADVAAGFASYILETDGAMRLHDCFLHVSYNGFHLTRDEAEDLDREQQEHDRLLAKFAA